MGSRRCKGSVADRVGVPKPCMLIGVTIRTPIVSNCGIATFDRTWGGGGARTAVGWEYIVG